jgi:hypothetical protein
MKSQNTEEYDEVFQRSLEEGHKAVADWLFNSRQLDKYEFLALVMTAKMALDNYGFEDKMAYSKIANAVPANCNAWQFEAALLDLAKKCRRNQ